MNKFRCFYRMSILIIPNRMLRNAERPQPPPPPIVSLKFKLLILIKLFSDDGSSLSEACSTPIIGTGSRSNSIRVADDMDDMDRGLHAANLTSRASLSSLGVSAPMCQNNYIQVYRRESKLEWNMGKYLLVFKKRLRSIVCYITLRSCVQLDHREFISHMRLVIVNQYKTL